MQNFRVVYDLPEKVPRVGILICSPNKDGILEKCIDSLIENTTYPDYRLYLCTPRTQYWKVISKHCEVFCTESENFRHVRRDPFEEYGYSKFANRLVRHCDEDVICLYNDDVYPVSKDWLSNMVAHALQPRTGVVGAKLLFPTNLIQHVGCVTGIGGYCAHLYKDCEHTVRTYNSRCEVTGNFSVVTGACSVMRKSIYHEVGGYDESLHAFNDVDFCMKLIQKGYYNVLDPNTTLVHHESFTRGYDDTEEKKQVFENDCRIMRERWGDKLLNDPHYNPNLSLESITFELADLPRYSKPWESSETPCVSG